jgi:DNA helicase-2/ATP-dependent DNA helicase PcrA
MINGERSYPMQSRFIDEIPEEYLETSGMKARGKSYIAEKTYEPRPMRTSGIGSVKVPMARKPIASNASSNNNTIDYTVGDTVKHIKFGKGIVTEMIKGGSDYEITVNFDSVGEKKMFATLAKLKKL